MSAAENLDTATTTPTVDAVTAAVDDPGAAQSTTVTTDWRAEHISALGKDYGGDDKVKAVLDRHENVGSVIKKLMEQDKLIASGAHKLKAAPGKDASPEVLAAYRKENGIPEKPGDYDLTLEGGIVFGEEDQPSLDFIRSVSHELNLPPAAVKDVAAKWHQFQEQQIAEREKADNTFHAEQSKVLTEAWGKDLKVNATRIEQVIKQIDGGDEAYDLIMGGRDADGNLIANSAKILQALHHLAFREQPNHTLVENSGFVGKSINDEIAEIEKSMGTKAYTNEMAERHSKLIAKRDGKALR